MSRLKGKVALVTGSTRGIGEAVAHRFAVEGASVVVTGRSRDDGARVVSAIHDAGGTAAFVPLDLAEERSVNDCIAEAVRVFGKLDVLVNNAAPTEYITGSKSNAGVQKIDGLVTEMSTESWRKIALPSIDGLFWTLRAAVPHLVRSGRGSIVNISSVAAVRGVRGVDAATASKGAMNALTLSVAVSYAPSVRCNALLGGPFETQGFAQMLANPSIRKAFNDTVLTGRIGLPDDIAHAAVYLASDESLFVTGQLLPIDGGMSVRVPVPVLQTGRDA